MKISLETYCGLYCGACDVYIANQKGSIDEKAREWQMKTEDLICSGCKTAITSIYCKHCKIKLCAQKNKVDFCYQCDQFPCSVLLAFKNDKNPHHSIALHNLRQIKDKGVCSWLDEQEIRWSCPDCRTKFSWYQESCSKCGCVLRNCIIDEEELR